MVKLDIKAYAEERKIPHLVHFTSQDNLLSILRWGVLPRTALGIRGISYVFNDSLRMDGRANASCLSISSPNGKMFYKYQRADAVRKWVVLLLDRSLLWKADCAFCPVNAASRIIARKDTDDLRSLSSFQAMFADYVGDHRRRSPSLEPFDPTDEQAEVLVFDSIETNFIKGIRFISKQECEDFLPRISDRFLDLCSWNSALFKPRSAFTV